VVMSLQPDEKGRISASRSSGWEHVLSDIKPSHTVRVHKSGLAAAAIQLVFGYVGGGYFYLEQNVKGLLSAAIFLVGIGVVVYLEMMVYPSSGTVNVSLMNYHYVAVALGGLLALIAYPATVIDCYLSGSRLEKEYMRRNRQNPLKARELSKAEKVERVFGEFDG